MNLLKNELQAGLIFSKTKSYKKKMENAKQDLQTFFSLCKNPYLALSWGKQSIILAHMIYQIKPDTLMLFLRSWESYLLHNFEETIKAFPFKINYREHFKDNVSWNTKTWQETRDMGSKDLQNMAEECFPEWDGVVMGLSKNESFARRLTCSIKNTKYRSVFKYKDGRYRCTPIQDWQNNDLAAYISENKITLLSTYKRTGLKGRTTARITRNNAEMNGLVELKKENINNYNLIVARFPELTSYS